MSSHLLITRLIALLNNLPGSTLPNYLLTNEASYSDKLLHALFSPDSSTALPYAEQLPLDTKFLFPREHLHTPRYAYSLNKH